MPDAAERPQVLQVLTRLGAGGPPLAVILLTRELNRRGYRTQLVTGKCDHVDFDMSYLLTPEDSIEWVPEMSRSVSLRNDLVALWRLYRIMRRVKPVIVQTHTAKAGALGRVAAFLAGVPVVIHTFHGHVMNGYFPPPISLAIRMTERILSRISTKILVLCPQQQQDLVERFRIAPREKVQVVPLGLELEPFQKLAVPQRPDRMLTVGWLGRLVEIKNIPLLIEVMEETLRRSDRIRFVIAGDGTQHSLLEEAVRRLPAERVDWVGWTPDVAGVISRCDVLIQTSKNEGTPVALIQGMAAGRPFVSTPAGGVVDMVDGPETTEPSGGRWFRNAVVVEPRADVFASVLCHLESDPSRLGQMGHDAAAFADSRYGLELLGRNYSQLYAGLSGLRSEFPQCKGKCFR